jgi:hypothetical protein
VAGVDLAALGLAFEAQLRELKTDLLTIPQEASDV